MFVSLFINFNQLFFLNFEYPSINNSLGLSYIKSNFTYEEASLLMICLSYDLNNEKSERKKDINVR